MRDMAAFAPAPPSSKGEGISVPGVLPGTVTLPASVLNAHLDADGVRIPELWQSSPKWAKLPLSLRQRWSSEWVASEVAKAEKEARKASRPARDPATRFTTDYAVKWGQKQTKVDGTKRPWSLIDREHYDFKHKRHHDLELGTDAIFDDGGLGRVGVQGAGRGERAAHYQRFLDRGGPDKAKRRGVRIFYLEFERGNSEPVKVEQWA